MAVIRFTEDDLAEANRANLRIWVTSLRSLPVWFSLLLIVVASAAAGPDNRIAATAILIAIVIVTAIISYRRTTLRLARRQLRETAALAHPIRYHWDADRFRAEGANGTTNMAWTDLHGWHRHSTGYLLYPSSMVSYPIPTRIFGEDAEESALLHALARAGVPERRLFRRFKRRAG